jgi:hypothetical protein
VCRSQIAEAFNRRYRWNEGFKIGLTWANGAMGLKTVSATGATVVIEEIAHYEVRCELFRIRAVGGLQRLD